MLHFAFADELKRMVVCCRTGSSRTHLVALVEAPVPLEQLEVEAPVTLEQLEAEAHLVVVLV